MNFIIKLLIFVTPLWITSWLVDSWILGILLGILIWSVIGMILYFVFSITNFLGITSIDLSSFQIEENEENPENTSFYINGASTTIVHANTISEVPETKGYRSTQEFILKVRVEGDKYSGLQEIVIEAHNRQEARQKAINMGYRVIQCT